MELIINKVWENDTKAMRELFNSVEDVSKR